MVKLVQLLTLFAKGLLHWTTTDKNIWVAIQHIGNAVHPQVLPREIECHNGTTNAFEGKIEDKDQESMHSSTTLQPRNNMGK